MLDVVQVTVVPPVPTRTGIPNTNSRRTPPRLEKRPRMFRSLLISSSPHLRPAGRADRSSTRRAQELCAADRSYPGSLTLRALIGGPALRVSLPGEPVALAHQIEVLRIRHQPSRSNV